MQWRFQHAHLDHFVRMKHVVADLLSPFGFHHVASDIRQVSDPLLLEHREQLGFEERHGARPASGWR
jgi:hypothetical protein